MEQSSPERVDPRVRIGHVHLKVAELDRSLRFYQDLLGFELTQRMGSQAAFLSAGGYHHHIGLNTWNSRGAAPPASGAIGLRSFEITLPNAEELYRVLERARAAGIETREEAGGSLIRDPAGNGVLLRGA
jgi:catechol 2,3-dioxygenase